MDQRKAVQRLVSAELVTIGGMTEERQKDFVRWAIEEKNYAISYVARIMVVIAAACAHSKLQVDLITTEGAILAKWPQYKPKPARSIYEPTDEELARLLRAPIPDDLRRWVLNAMATAGRPEAVLELQPAQRKRDFGLIDLNPDGRRQNKKYRPTVRELPSQTRWLDAWEKHLHIASGKRLKPVLRYCGYASVDSVDTALQRWRVKPEVNVPFLSVYSIRHRAASVLRASKAPRVLEEQVNYQLGHRRSSNRISRGYGQYGPEYLAEAAEALEAWVTRVVKLSQQKPSAKTPRRAA
jgi:hypothetical protein